MTRFAHPIRELIGRTFSPLIHPARGHHEDGQDMVEYALLVGLISITALALIILVGPYLVNTFQYLVNGLASA
jgi:Flp pilus assembly pilin Flp